MSSDFCFEYRTDIAVGIGIVVAIVVGIEMPADIDPDSDSDSDPEWMRTFYPYPFQALGCALGAWRTAATPPGLGGGVEK